MLNVVSMVGRLVAEPSWSQKKINEADTLSVIRYRIAVDRDYRQNGKRPTDFFLCKAYGGSADYAKQNFEQGDTIGLTGKLYTWPYKPAGEEQAHICTIIHVTNHYIIKKRTEAARVRELSPVQDPTEVLPDEWSEEELPPLPPFFEDGTPYEAIYAYYKPQTI